MLQSRNGETFSFLTTCLYRLVLEIKIQLPASKAREGVIIDHNLIVIMPLGRFY